MPIELKPAATKKLSSSDKIVRSHTQKLFNNNIENEKFVFEKINELKTSFDFDKQCYIAYI